MEFPPIKDARVLQGLQFNCPKCDVAVGELCRSLTRDTPMARWIHPHRIPPKLSTGGYQEFKLWDWLRSNVSLFTEV